MKVDHLNKTLEDLKDELNKSRNVGQEAMDDSRSEVMSTSTVSRVEEQNRMKDVEDSFEERYSKLKLIAIKLKKKVADQDKIIKEMEMTKRDKKIDEDSSALREKIS